jgi:hypothetical protein
VSPGLDKEDLNVSVLQSRSFQGWEQPTVRHHVFLMKKDEFSPRRVVMASRW